MADIEQRERPAKALPAREFAKRLDTAIRGFPPAPAGHGRQRWLRKQLVEKFGAAPSPEAIRKWFSGEAQPRPNVLARIAEVLEVDEAWLSLGLTVTVASARSGQGLGKTEGAVNLVAGLIQLSGGSIAAGDGDIDLYAIINGEKLDIKVKLARREGQKWHVATPTPKDDRLLVAVVPGEDLRSFHFIRLTADTVRKLGRAGGGITELSLRQQDNEFQINGQPVSIIDGFANLARGPGYRSSAQ